MHDIRIITEDPNGFDKALAKRGADPIAQKLVTLDEERRSVIARLQDMQGHRNTASKEIGKAKGAGDEERAQALMAEVAKLKADLQAGEEDERQATTALTDALMAIPNLPDPGVPVGPDEAANEEVRKVGEPRTLDDPQQHFDLGEALGLMDFEAATAMSGARFVVLKGGLARLERAIANFMLDLHTSEFGYTEVVPPLLVRDNALEGTGQLPKFAEDQFRTTDDRWLIPTAEVPLTNLVRDQITALEDLPLRFTAWTPCFRSEAGSAGRDTRGMIRLHQFSKVELVSITAPDKSEDELERMTACAEEVLKRLDLAYRVMLLSTGDMGFGAVKTYDLEVWLPGQGAYREISSCSNCRDFQARRMKARTRVDGEKGTQFVHTLNGSGMAVGRTMVAIMENYQQADGSIVVPDVLQPYMGGLRVIEKP